ncbi:MAG: hypothetical protein RL064_1380 [Bacteroidota bacterium]
MKNYALIIVCLFVIACNDNATTEEESSVASITAPANVNYEVVKVYPHDVTSYTQGLEWNGNKLIESTGNYGKSILHILDTNMKQVGKKIELGNQYFGEGTTLFGGKIFQLTWKEHKVFVYDEKTLKLVNEFYWPYEGWGLTHNDTAIIVSTGSSNLYFVDPATFSIKKTLGVFNSSGYVNYINELEFANGKIYANIYEPNNIYTSDDIVVIDPRSGQVSASMNLANILPKVNVMNDPRAINPGYVLNGIAYKKETNTFFVTGKCWPVMLELKLK